MIAKQQKLLTVVILITLLTLTFAVGCSKAETAPSPQPSAQDKPQAAPLTQGGGESQITKTKQDSGRYQGQIDSNSIEIKISGVPDNISARAFQLSEPLKENFAKYGFKKDEQVIFTYTEKPGERPIITELSRIK